jgi:hypothetical protein
MLTYIYKRELTVSPFFVVPLALIDDEAAMALGPQQLSLQSGELIRELYERIARQDLSSPFIAQILPFGKKVLVVNTVQTKVPDKQSGRYGLKLSYGALVDKDVFMACPAVCSRVFRFFTQHFLDAYRASTSLEGLGRIVIHFQQTDQNVNDIIDEAVADKLISRFETDFDVDKSLKSSIARRLGRRKSTLLRRQTLKGFQSAEEAETFWKGIDDQLDSWFSFNTVDGQENPKTRGHLAVKPTKKSLAFIGLVSLGLLLSIFFSLHLKTDLNKRRENIEKNAAQESTIVELRRTIQQLTQFSLDRELREIEISFKPSPEQSFRIAEAYRKVKSTVKGVPYSAATMRAERIGDHWKIEFEPVSRPEGVIRFAPISAKQVKRKGFEEVLQQATLPLWIKWGAGAETELEPNRNQFPSVIIMSENALTYLLRPPLIALHLKNLSVDPTFILRGAGDIKTLRFHSGDPGVIFDQMVDLNWKEDRGSDTDEDIYIKRTKPFLSGPHRLEISFKALP